VKALALVLVALGLLLVWRAVPQGRAKQWATSTPTLGVSIAVLVLSGLLTVLVRSAADGPGNGQPQHRAADEVGVCGDAAMHSRCTALLVGAAGVLDLIKSLPVVPGGRQEAPRITIPGSGDPVLAAATQTSLTSAQVRPQLEAAMRAGGWTALAASPELLRFERGGLTAAVALVPTRGGMDIRLSVTG
jgi:hypothetical protein